MRNLQKHSFISLLKIMLGVGMLLKQSCNAQAPSSLVCPSPTSIAPCACKQYVGNGFQAFNSSITIDCKEKNLDDSKINSVLNAFLAPGLSPVTGISASLNQITKVPKQVSKFPALLLVDFSSNQISEIRCDDGKPFIKNNPYEDIWISLADNQIRHIPSGVFHFSSAFYVTIDFTKNRIFTVSSDAFRFPSAKKVDLRFNSNQISSLPDGVFNFPSVTNGVSIRLQSNKLRTIPPASVFNFPSTFSIQLGLGSNMITSIQQNAFNFTFYAKGFVEIDLTQNSIPTIPCGTFNYPLTSYAMDIKLGFNQIKTVPSCAFNFPSTKYIGVQLNDNSITTITPGSFNFPLGDWVYLNLANNQISAIPPDTFAQGIFHYIQLENNQLKRFESAVFKSPLNKSSMFVKPDSKNVDIGGNPIDCSTDPCHLAWLLKSNNSSQLLHRIIADGVCSNNGGPPFSALNAFDFTNNCPCSFN